MKDGQFGWGIVGCGVIAPWHRGAVEHCPEAQVVAACDIEEEKGRQFAAESGERVAFYRDYEDLMGDENVDIVSVCTPSGIHGEVTIVAAQAGKHVLCEKPIEITREQMDAMIQACRDHNVKLGGIFQRRTYDSSKQVRAAVQNGELGKMVLGDVFLKYYRSQAYYNSAGWRGTWELDGGGALMNQGVHGIDMLLWVMGDVESVYARADHLVRDIPVEDTAIALLKYKNGAWGVLEGTTSVNPGEATRLELHGKLGTIILQEGDIVKWASTTGDDDHAQPRELEQDTGEKKGAVSDPTSIGMAGHIYLVNDIVQAVKEDRDPLIPGESARKAVELILAIYESARTGKEVRVDWEENRGIL